MNQDCYFFLCPHCGLENTLPLGVDWRPRECDHCLAIMGQNSAFTLVAPVFATLPVRRRNSIIGAMVVLIVLVALLALFLFPQYNEAPLVVTERLLPSSLSPLAIVPPQPTFAPSTVLAKEADLLPQPSFPIPETLEPPSIEDEEPGVVDSDPQTVIQNLYAELQTSDDDHERVALRRKIHQSVQAHAKFLEEQGAWYELVGFFLFLQGLEPEYPPYAIKMAMAYMALGDFHNASNSVFALSEDPIWGEQVKQILQAATQQTSAVESHNTVVALISQNNGFLVEALLNDEVNVRLMLDTGATLTVISRDFLDRSGLTVISTGEQQNLLTANGSVQASLVIFSHISLQDRRLVDFKVAVLQESPFTDFDGLLGMDFLGHFRFSIEPDKKRLVLADK